MIREFGPRFGAFERIDLETTFRCADHISAVATDFVLRSPAQICKTVRATRKVAGPAVHVDLPGEGGLSLPTEALDRIGEDAARRHEGISDVLLLDRYRHLKPRNLDSLGRQHPRPLSTYMPVHRAMGREADYAVVFGLCTGRFGFPAGIADDPLPGIVTAEPASAPESARPAASPGTGPSGTSVVPWDRPSSRSSSVFRTEDRKDVARSCKSDNASRDSLGSARGSHCQDSGDVIQAAIRFRVPCESAP